MQFKLENDIQTASNPGTAHDYINTYVARHDIRVRGRENRLDFRCSRWGINDLQVCNFSYGKYDTEIRIGDSDDEICFLLVPLQGKSLVARRHDRIVMVPGLAKVFSASEASLFSNTDGFSNLNLRISYRGLKEFLASELEVPVSSVFQFSDSTIDTNGKIRYLLEYLDWISQQLNRQDASHILQNPHFARHTYDTILNLLVSSVDNNYQEIYLSNDCSPAAPAYVREAEEYIVAHLREPITIGDVARQIGIAARTLYSGFHHHRKYSAAEFLRNQRLALAREELKNARQQKRTVTAVAFDCGFLHLSKFAQSYRRRYGENPSDTLKR